MQFDWTDERTELLKQMWNEGLSAGQIAAALGTSRNSAIGKVHRLKLPGRTASASQERPKRPDRRLLGTSMAIRNIKAKINAPTNMKPVELPPPAGDHEIPQSQRRTLTDLPFSGACKWPVGRPGREDFFFCGGKTSARGWGILRKESCPYCDWHADRAIGNGTPSERRAGETLVAEARADRAA